MTMPDQPELTITEWSEPKLVKATVGGAAASLLTEVQQQSAEQDAAYISEAETILHRVDRELVVEEALTRELMARHGL